MGLKKADFDGALTCAIGVRNLSKAMDWYVKVLGFELLYKMDDQGWCEMQTPVSKVNVGLSEREDIEIGGGAILTWGVKDIELAKKILQEHKVKFDGEIMTIPDMAKILTFYDLDGNSLMIAQDLTKS
jgi:predicted enzyme related to lactoylglutathione lyase